MRYVTAILIVALLCVGCGENTKLTSTVFRGQYTDAKVLVGVQENNAEVGLLVGYVDTDDMEWGPEPDYFGGYVKLYLTQDVTIEDTPDYSPLQPFLEALHAQPYVRMELIRPVDRSVSMDSLQPTWIAGTAFTLSEDGNIALNVEYLDGDFGEEDVFIGIQYKFK